MQTSEVTGTDSEPSETLHSIPDGYRFDLQTEGVRGYHDGGHYSCTEDGEDEMPACPYCGETDPRRIERIRLYDHGRWNYADGRPTTWIEAKHGWVTIWSCCYSICSQYREAHILNEEDKCEYCAECDEHCNCSRCDDCSARGQDICDNCESCSDCCGCYRCEGCGEVFSDVNENGYCESCAEDQQCDCDAPRLKFHFPADGHGTISQDERLSVELPKGTIDSEGISKITKVVRNSFGSPGDVTYYITCCDIDQVISAIGPTWQTRRGNFTRRLSSGLHKKGHKISTTALTEVGNIARAHSTDSSSWEIAVTRDLNQGAAAFYHEGSCWFTGGSYGESLCCLKNWGGMGLRTFDEGRYGEKVAGRAWIQPIKKLSDGIAEQRLSFVPTHNALTPTGYVIYNGYGNLNGYNAARIVAHLTGLTYRKIHFHADNQYVNGPMGYLVSDSATCEATDDVYLSGEPHSKFDREA